MLCMMDATTRKRSQASPLPPDSALPLSARRRLALDAEVDVRTLERALAGLKVKPMCRERIERTLAARGLIQLLPQLARSESSRSEQ